MITTVCGAECGVANATSTGAAADKHWDGMVGTTLPTMDTAQKRTGNRAWKFTPGAVAPYTQRSPTAATYNVVGIRMYGYFDALPASAQETIGTIILGAGTALNIQVTSAGLLRAGSTTLGWLNGGTCVAAQWFGVEAQFDLRANPNVTYFRTDIGATGTWTDHGSINNAQALTTITRFRVGLPGATTGTENLWLDDIVLYEGTTINEHYPIGAGYVKAYQANASLATVVTTGDLKYNNTYPNLVRSLSPVSYWRLGEASGTVATDDIGTYPGTYVGSPTLGATGALAGAGDADTSVTFNGTSQYVTLPSGVAALFGSTLSWSVGFWIKATPDTAYRRVFDVGGAFKVISVNSNFYALRVGVDLFYPAPTAGAWEFMVYTYDGSNVRFYRNGSNTHTAASAASAGSPTVAELARDNAGSDYFAGTADELAVWNRVLTPDEIASLYSLGITTTADIVNGATDLHTYVDDVDGSGFMDLDASTADYISQNVADATNDVWARHVQFSFEDSAEAGPPRYVHVISAFRSAATTANELNERASDDGTTWTAIWGSWSAATNVGYDVSETTGMQLGKTLTAMPSGGLWTAAGFNALRVQVGHSDDISPIPYLDAIGIEAEFVPVAAVGTAVMPLFGSLSVPLQERMRRLLQGWSRRTVGATIPQM